MSDIEIPTFNWASIYYPQILESLITFKRVYVPELTDESPQEPLIQGLRAFACVGHLSNTLVDLVGNEHTLPTSRLPETVRNMLRLIDYEMASATPSQVELVYELAQVLASSVEVVPQYASAATVPSGGVAAVFFGALEALTCTRTDEIGACFGIEEDVATDWTADANSTPGVGAFQPWATPDGSDGSDNGDTLLIVHPEALFDEVDVAITAAGTNMAGRWEYYSGVWEKAQPSDVTDNGTSLTLELTGYLGFVAAPGTWMRVRLNSSGAYEDALSYYSGGVNKVDVGLLGQTTPSTTEVDYTIGSDWDLLPDVVDGTITAVHSFEQNGVVSWTLPENLVHQWNSGTHEGVEGFAVRFRLTGSSAMNPVTIGQLRIDTGRQYVKRTVTQGRRQIDNPLGSSTGVADQRFEGSKNHFLDASSDVSVDGVDWAEVSDWLSSRSTDRHYRVELGEDDRPEFVFGDGVAGAIPPIGVGNIRAEYRYGAFEDGNVGANTITSDKAGLRYVNKLWNPRPAAGWAEAEGSTEASLELVKVEGPATLRVKDVALGPDDVETLAKRARKYDDTLIAVSRVRAIEEGFGPKTIEAVLVASGGALAAQSSLDDFSEFFNGDQLSSPTVRKRVVANQEVTAVNYTRRAIAVTATVEDTGDVTVAQIEAALTILLKPEALKKDGITWVWDFASKVAVSRIEHEIFRIANTIIDVDVTLPAADIQLGARELPYVDTLLITLV